MSVKSWEATEKQVCRLLRAEHVGGPGQPDCRLGAGVVEVKDHKDKVDRSILRTTAEKPWARGLPLIVVSTSDFTDGAIAFAKDRGNTFLYGFDPAVDKIWCIWPPEAVPRRPETAPASKTVWWPLAAAGGLAVGGVLLAVKHWAARRAA